MNIISMNNTKYRGLFNITTSGTIQQLIINNDLEIDVSSSP